MLGRDDTFAHKNKIMTLQTPARRKLYAPGWAPAIGRHTANERINCGTWKRPPRRAALPLSRGVTRCSPFRTLSPYQESPSCRQAGASHLLVGLETGGPTIWGSAESNSCFVTLEQRNDRPWRCGTARPEKLSGWVRGKSSWQFLFVRGNYGLLFIYTHKHDRYLHCHLQSIYM